MLAMWSSTAFPASVTHFWRVSEPRRRPAAWKFRPPTCGRSAMRSITVVVSLYEKVPGFRARTSTTWIDVPVPLVHRAHCLLVHRLLEEYARGEGAGALAVVELPDLDPGVSRAVVVHLAVRLEGVVRAGPTVVSACSDGRMPSSR